MVALNVYLIRGGRDLSVVFISIPHLLEGEHAMKDEDSFSNDGSPPAASGQQRSGESDRNALSSIYPGPQDAPASAHAPKTPQRLPAPPPWRLLLVALMIVVLVALAGGYGLFHAISPSSRQASSAFQQVTPCPFRLGAG